MGTVQITENKPIRLRRAFWIQSIFRNSEYLENHKNFTWKKWRHLRCHQREMWLDQIRTQVLIISSMNHVVNYDHSPFMVLELDQFKGITRLGPKIFIFMGVPNFPRRPPFYRNCKNHTFTNKSFRWIFWWGISEIFLGFFNGPFKECDLTALF